MFNHGPLRRCASPEVALEALGDFGAPGGVAHRKVQGDFARRDWSKEKTQAAGLEFPLRR